MTAGISHCLTRALITLDFANVDAVKTELAREMTCTFADCSEPRDCVAKRTEYARGQFKRLQVIRRVA